MTISFAHDTPPNVNLGTRPLAFRVEMRNAKDSAQLEGHLAETLQLGPILSFGVQSVTAPTIPDGCTLQALPRSPENLSVDAQKSYLVDSGPIDRPSHSLSVGCANPTVTDDAGESISRVGGVQ
jgi:hypothetical protein